MPRQLTRERARRLALGATGLARPRVEGRVDVRHHRRVLATTGVVQLDSVNVAARAHYLPAFSRLGPYDTERFDDWLWRSGENVEYLGHEASVTPLATWTLLRHRMEQRHPWRAVASLLDEHPGYVEEVHEHVAADGPLTVGDLADPGSRTGSWWGWNRGRIALEWLYSRGRLGVAQRDASFTLHYDLIERVVPPAVLATEVVPRPIAQRALLELAARACGVATEDDLAAYWRIPIREARAGIASLVADGVLEPVEVPGWGRPAVVHPDVPVPREVGAACLLSPFDPVVWHRDRALRLFDFHYRIEIYVPAEKRVHGYYVLPFLLDDRLVARVDLKLDRAGGRLLVRSAWHEPGADVPRVARALHAELVRFARWQGAGEVEVEPRGDLAPALRSLA
ncbi:MAG: winged helix-turn-helix domain-containing protein [Actinomycetes bacterium]